MSVMITHESMIEYFPYKAVNFCQKYHTKFENSLTEWVQNYLKLMENHKENEIWFSNYGYQYGIGKIKDKFKAFKSYLKSAEEGNPFAQNNLGYCYQKVIGITKDEKKAFELYLKAANGGDVYAQYNFGIWTRI
ncbi:hypothetical protein C1645_743515 [Glomus cerebriforme]|uniref:Sel1 repeat family protein n=1 Tax=Glomus cerebriforme TaxID=658196 RepID=A0A397S918_9GLOM|nr:hypothetical protein C1645_743515 [Glomus cerebriforme]